MPLASDPEPTPRHRPGFFARWWWLIALLLLVLPLALIVYFMLSTPDVQTFDYKVR
jgi:hypothetical protein